MPRDYHMHVLPLQTLAINFPSVCFSPNAFSNWCASIALSHCLKDNAEQKEQLLRVQLATSVGTFGFVVLKHENLRRLKLCFIEDLYCVFQGIRRSRCLINVQTCCLKVVQCKLRLVFLVCCAVG